MPKQKRDPNAIYISERLQEKSAAHLSLRPDHRGGTYGLRKNHSHQLVPIGAGRIGAPAGHPHQRVFRQSRHFLEKRTGRL